MLDVMQGEAPGVLVVEDDESTRALVERWLERAGFRVTVVGSAEEAFDSLASTVPDAICLDLELPGMDGLSALDAIRKTHPSVPFVVTTARREPATIVTAMQHGAYDYLVKPLDGTRVVTSVRNAVERYRSSLLLESLAREAAGDSTYQGMIGASAPMRALFRTLDRVADRDVTVLVHGESGTGKELVARAIHDRSARAKGPLVAVNCAAVPESLQEAELFGTEKGAFTGATARRAGLFERAHGGTLFLDEVAELGPRLQAQLLRVLEERTFHRIGGSETVKTDFRLIAASHANLEDAVRAGRFREDLFFRISVFDVELPPLRDREDDVILLARRFVELGGSRAELSADALAALRAHAWPGNVRELRNAIDRALVVCEGDVIRASDLPLRLRAGGSPRGERESSPRLDVDDSGTLASRERRALAEALERHGWQVSEVVRELGIGRTTVYRKIKEYGLTPGRRDEP